MLTLLFTPLSSTVMYTYLHNHWEAWESLGLGLIQLIRELYGM